MTLFLQDVVFDLQVGIMGSTPECKIKKQLIKIFLHPPHLHARKERKPITTS